MSEQTGATERIEISGTLEFIGEAMYLVTDCNKCQGCGMEHPSYQCSSCQGTGIEAFRIVPADAVVVTPEIAATAAEACEAASENVEISADFLDSLGAPDAVEMRDRAERFRASSAAIRQGIESLSAVTFDQRIATIDEIEAIAWITDDVSESSMDYEAWQSKYEEQREIARAFVERQQVMTPGMRLFPDSAATVTKDMAEMAADACDLAAGDCSCHANQFRDQGCVVLAAEWTEREMRYRSVSHALRGDV